MSEIQTFIKNIIEKYEITYRCSVNLEGTIDNMRHYGLTLDQIKDIVIDIFDNLEFIDEN